MPEKTTTGNRSGNRTGHPPRLLDQVRDRIRARHFSLRTEQTYLHWIKRFILFHGKRHPRDLGAPEVEAFLSHLATARGVSASTQNLALAALLFLYREVLGVQLPWLDGVIRAKKPQRLPTVLTQGEVLALLCEVHGTPGLCLRLLYGAGLRKSEGLTLRVKDVDLDRRQLLIRGAKGGKDRVTVLPASLVEPLRLHFAARRRQFDEDLRLGRANVDLPWALARKSPGAARTWAGSSCSWRTASRWTRAPGRCAATTSGTGRCPEP